MGGQEKNWKHDCEKCVYLGEHLCQTKEWDLYFCGCGPIETVIARYGDEGENYVSGLPIAKMLLSHGKTEDPLVQALLRAREKGLIS